MAKKVIHKTVEEGILIDTFREGERGERVTTHQPYTTTTEYQERQIQQDKD